MDIESNKELQALIIQQAAEITDLREKLAEEKSTADVYLKSCIRHDKANVPDIAQEWPWGAEVRGEVCQGCDNRGTIIGWRGQEIVLAWDNGAFCSFRPDELHKIDTEKEEAPF